MASPIGWRQQDGPEEDLDRMLHSILECFTGNSDGPTNLHQHIIAFFGGIKAVYV